MTVQQRMNMRITTPEGNLFIVLECAVTICILRLMRTICISSSIGSGNGFFSHNGVS